MILDEIVANTHNDVAGRKELYPVKLLEGSPYFAAPCLSLVGALTATHSSGIIAEIKKGSPSKGLINPYINPAEVGISYKLGGAAAISILTDKKYFYGSTADLTAVRKVANLPILRKDFIIDPYQVIEARSIGADVILLIAAILTKQELANLALLATSLGLEALIEVHEEAELDKIPDNIKLIGVNNRNLQTLQVDLAQSFKLIEALPKDTICISESGIKTAAQLGALRSAGYHGFLIGEQFMQHQHPGEALLNFLQDSYES